MLEEYGEMTLEQIDAELTDGMLIAILPESVVAYFDNFQATLNEFIAEIEALIAGENQELMAGVSEIDALYSLQVLANQGVIPQEVYAIIDALIDGTMANPILNTDLAVDELIDMLIDAIVLYEEKICSVPDGYIFYFLSIEVLEVLAELYQGVTTYAQQQT